MSSVWTGVLKNRRTWQPGGGASKGNFFLPVWFGDSEWDTASWQCSNPWRWFWNRLLKQTVLFCIKWVTPLEYCILVGSIKDQQTDGWSVTVDHKYVNSSNTYNLQIFLFQPMPPMPLLAVALHMWCECIISTYTLQHTISAYLKSNTMRFLICGFCRISKLSRKQFGSRARPK